MLGVNGYLGVELDATQQVCCLQRALQRTRSLRMQAERATLGGLPAPYSIRGQVRSDSSLDTADSAARVPPGFRGKPGMTEGPGTYTGALIRRTHYCRPHLVV